MKKIITIILGLFVLLSMAVLIYKEVTKEQVATPVVNPVVTIVATPIIKIKATTVISSKKWIDATYFMTTQRCYTCKLMERYIKESLSENFKIQMSDKKIQFQAINIDLPENKHYIKDYKLYTKSFVLSLKKDGKEEKWINCDKIWDLARNEQGFKKYIKEQVQTYMEIL